MMRKKSHYNITADPISWNELRNLMHDNFSMSDFIDNSIKTRIVIIKKNQDVIKLEKKIKEKEKRAEKLQDEVANLKHMLETMKKEKKKKIEKEKKKKADIEYETVRSHLSEVL